MGYNALNYHTDAINIKTYSLSEADRIIVMYSKDKGLIKGVAKGSKKPKNKLGGRMDLLVANKLMLVKGKNLDTICQAENLNTFNNLRTDIDKMIYSSYIAELVSNFSLENDPNSVEIYDIFYNVLERISNAKNIVEIILATIRFQLKMMRISGYALQLKTCINCCDKIDNDIINLSLIKGGIICGKCSHSNTIPIYKKIRDFLVVLAESDFDANTYHDKKATEKICKYCFNIVQKFIQIHSLKKFKTLDLIGDKESELISLSS